MVVRLSESMMGVYRMLTRVSGWIMKNVRRRWLRFGIEVLIGLWGASLTDMNFSSWGKSRNVDAF